MQTLTLLLCLVLWEMGLVSLCLTFIDRSVLNFIWLALAQLQMLVFHWSFKRAVQIQLHFTSGWWTVSNCFSTEVGALPSIHITRKITVVRERQKTWSQSLQPVVSYTILEPVKWSEITLSEDVVMYTVPPCQAKCLLLRPALSPSYRAPGGVWQLPFLELSYNVQKSFMPSGWTADASHQHEIYFIRKRKKWNK